MPRQHSLPPSGSSSGITCPSRVQRLIQRIFGDQQCQSLLLYLHEIVIFLFYCFSTSIQGREITIPRLELTAAVVSVTVSKMLKKELGRSEIEEPFWIDSMVVLGYINNHARRFHTFVANRIQRIHLHTSPDHWRYVLTDENPADHISRSLTASELLSSNWLTGPTFLWKGEIVPLSDTMPELSVGDPEVRKIQTFNTETEGQTSIADQLLKFSSWTHAIRAIACIQRQIKMTR